MVDAQAKTGCRSQKRRCKHTFCSSNVRGPKQSVCPKWLISMATVLPFQNIQKPQNRHAPKHQKSPRQTTSHSATQKPHTCQRATANANFPLSPHPTCPCQQRPQTQNNKRCQPRARVTLNSRTSFAQNKSLSARCGAFATLHHANSHE